MSDKGFVVVEDLDSHSDCLVMVFFSKDDEFSIGCQQQGSYGMDTGLDQDCVYCYGVVYVQYGVGCAEEMQRGGNSMIKVAPNMT